MARTPALELYQQKSTPDAATTPMLRAPDLGPGIGASVSRLGAALGEAANTAAEINRIDTQKRQDDARLTVAQMMAQYRADASSLLRTTQENAPNGFQDLTHSYSQALAQQRTQYLQDPRLSTPEARAYFDQATALYNPDALDAAAGAESQGRDQWQADTIKATIESNANILVGDPSQYGRIRSEFEQTVGGISNPNLRRDALDNGTHAFSAAAVSGMIDHDPAGTLRLLQAEHPEGVVAELSASARATAINQAQAEIDRRASKWRSDLRERMGVQMDMMNAGVAVDSPIGVDTVRAAFGDNAANAWHTQLEIVQQRAVVQQMSVPDLLHTVQEAADTSSLENRSVQVGRQQAAQQELTAIGRDPMAYLLSNNYVNGDVDAQDAFASSVTTHPRGASLWRTFLQQRASAALENAGSRGIPARVFTEAEASQIAGQLRGMTPIRQAQVLESMRNALGGNSPIYRIAASQITPGGSPARVASAYVGQPNGGSVIAGRILEGNALITNSAASTENGQSSGPRFQMPSDAALRRTWTTATGVGNQSAYRGLGAAEAQDYDAFRALYASLASRRGQFDGGLNQPAATEAANAIVNKTTWAGQPVMMPPGYDHDLFVSSLRAAYARLPEHTGDLSNQGLEHFNLLPLGGGSYALAIGESFARDGQNRNVVISVSSDAPSIPLSTPPVTSHTRSPVPIPAQPNHVRR